VETADVFWESVAERTQGGKSAKIISATDESGFLQENAEITENEEGMQPGYLDRGFLPQIAQMDADGKRHQIILGFPGRKFIFGVIPGVKKVCQDKA